MTHAPDQNPTLPSYPRNLGIRSLGPCPSHHSEKADSDANIPGIRNTLTSHRLQVIVFHSFIFPVKTYKASLLESLLEVGLERMRGVNPGALGPGKAEITPRKGKGCRQHPLRILPNSQSGSFPQPPADPPDLGQCRREHVDPGMSPDR